MTGPINDCGVWNCPDCHPDVELPVSDPETWDRATKRWEPSRVTVDNSIPGITQIGTSGPFQLFGPSPGIPVERDREYKLGWFDGFHAAKAAT